MKLLLINSPNPVDESGKNANHSLFPHIGLVQLASRVRHEFENKIRIKILDGGVIGLDDIFAEIDGFSPDITGISVLTPTYGEGLKIAKKAKSVGSKVILGDDHAIFFPIKILENRQDIDYIITNDVAEQPFIELINALYYEKSVDKVCSLVYRKNGRIHINKKRAYTLQRHNTIPDLSLIEDKIDLYSDKYYAAHGHLHGKKIRSITMNNARGCENGRVRCSYCSIADLSVNTGDPKVHWDIVRQYHDRYSINLFFEVYDSFTASPRYVNALLETMPLDIKIKVENGDIEFMIYARALGLLKRENADKFSRLGVRRVNIGLDSGDEKMLEAQRKNKTTDGTNLNALKLLKSYNMSVHGSFMLGAPGETVESVDNTIDHILQCMEHVDFSSLEISRLFPLPNSPIWDMIVNNKHPLFYKDRDDIKNNLAQLDVIIKDEILNYLNDKYSNNDLFFPTDLMPDWYKNFTHIEESYALEKINIIDRVILSKNIQTGKNIG